MLNFEQYNNAKFRTIKFQFWTETNASRNSNISCRHFGRISPRPFLKRIRVTSRLTRQTTPNEIYKIGPVDDLMNEQY